MFGNDEEVRVERKEGERKGKEKYVKEKKKGRAGLGMKFKEGKGWNGRRGGKEGLKGNK